VAITNYGTLKSTIASRINQSGHDTAIEDAVAAATKRLTRELRVVDQEGASASDLSDEYTDLPVDFNGMRSLRTADGKRLEYYVPEAFQTMVERIAYLAKPIFTIEYERLRVHPAPGPASVLSVVMLYHAKITDLASDTDSNWVITDHPDLYLAASMVEILLHLKDREAAAIWEDRTKQLIEQVIVASRRRRYTSGQLAIRNV
jgi:hypothetical protein